MRDGAIQALQSFFNILDEVDSSVVSMYDSGSFSVVSDAPVLQAVSTIKYLLPDDIFYFLYTSFLIMCLYTTCLIVTAIVTRILNAFDRIKYTASGISMSGGLQSFKSFFR